MTSEEYNFYQLEAKRHKASLAINGHLAVIYMEDKEDEAFWSVVLKHYKTDSTFFEKHTDFEKILQSQLLYTYPEMEKIGNDINVIWGKS